MYAILYVGICGKSSCIVQLCNASLLIQIFLICIFALFLTTVVAIVLISNVYKVSNGRLMPYFSDLTDLKSLTIFVISINGTL